MGCDWPSAFIDGSIPFLSTLHDAWDEYLQALNGFSSKTAIIVVIKSRQRSIIQSVIDLFKSEAVIKLIATASGENNESVPALCIAKNDRYCL